jgi:hypothetical protein
MTEIQRNEVNMSREDIAFFIKHLWEALLAPSWSRDDLIDLGKAVFARTPLSKIEQKRFDRLLPHLTQMVKSLGVAVQAKLLEEIARANTNAIQAKLLAETAEPQKTTAPAITTAATVTISETPVVGLNTTITSPDSPQPSPAALATPVTPTESPSGQ